MEILYSVNVLHCSWASSENLWFCALFTIRLDRPVCFKLVHVCTQRSSPLLLGLIAGKHSFCLPVDGVDHHHGERCPLPQLSLLLRYA